MRALSFCNSLAKLASALPCIRVRVGVRVAVRVRVRDSRVRARVQVRIGYIGTVESTMH